MQKPENDFNKDFINELKNNIKDFSDNDKFIETLMNEVKIHSDLVWDKHTEDLVGYVESGLRRLWIELCYTGKKWGITSKRIPL